MASYRTTRLVRARTLSISLEVTKYVAAQEQIRVTAQKSPAYGPVVTPLLTQWNTSTDKLSALHQQELTLKQQLAQIRQQKLQALEQAQQDGVAYVGGVESVAGNDPGVIQGLGLQIAGSSQAKGSAAPEPPATLALKAGTDPGGLHVTWARSTGARTYQLQISPEPVTATSWTGLPSQTKRTLKVGDLVSGAAYQVRVQAVGAGGTSAWSTAARGNAR